MIKLAILLFIVSPFLLVAYVLHTAKMAGVKKNIERLLVESALNHELCRLPINAYYAQANIENIRNFAKKVVPGFQTTIENPVTLEEKMELMVQFTVLVAIAVDVGAANNYTFNHALNVASEERRAYFAAA